MTTTLTFTEPQVRALLGAIRSKIEEAQVGLEDSHDAGETESAVWYEERIAELTPLAERLNRAGLRLTGGRP